MKMFILRRLMVVMLCLSSLTLCGCPAVAWVAVQVAGPEKAKPLYEPPPDKHVLVFVDDACRPVSYQPVKAELTRALCQQLVANGTVKSTVTYEQVLDAMETESRMLSVLEIGQKVQADLVLYVNIEKFSLREEGNNTLWHGHMQTSVRWIDPNGETRETVRLWPTDRVDGHLMPEIDLPVSNDESPSFGADLAKVLSSTAADQIARLFYESVAAK